jgi:hypothetical protein
MEVTMAYTKKDKLLSRLRSNYLNFQCSLDGASRTKLFEMAERIATVKEAYEFALVYDEWEDEDEIGFLLLFQDPLTILADAWERHKADCSYDMADAFERIFWEDNVIAEYPLLNAVATGYFTGGEDEIKLTVADQW